MLAYLGEKFEHQRLREGVYIAEFEHNFDHELRHKEITIRKFFGYGVCDNYRQILDRNPDLLTSVKKYVIGLTPVIKAVEPDMGGWRWHKWGEYIGIHEPQCEYLYDEPDIEKVYCYEIYEIV